MPLRPFSQTTSSSSVTQGDKFSKGITGRLYSAAGYKGRDYTAGGGGLYDVDKLTPLEYFPGKGFVDFDPASVESMDRRLDLARSGHPSLNAATAYTTGALRGDYLNSNPWVDAMYGQAADAVESRFNRAVLPNLEARFSRAGGRGGAYEGALSDAYGTLGSELGNLATSIYGENYARERGMQHDAARVAPVLSAEAFANLDQMRSVGAEREEMGRIKLQDEMDRFWFNQNEPFLRVNRIVEGAAPLPMAAGGGQTRSSTEGMSYVPSQPSGPGTWERILTSIL